MMTFDEMTEMDLSHEEKIAAEAKRLVRSSLLMCVIGILVALAALGIEAVLMTHATLAERTDPGPSSLFKVAAFGLLSLLTGSIRLGQGLLMLATKKRIDLTFKRPMTASERTLTYAYASAWTSFVIGGAMVWALLA